MSDSIVYPYLPEGKKILYVPENNIFIRAAQEIRDNDSTDLMNPTGAVIVKNETVIYRSANKAKLENPTLLKLHSKYCVRRILRIPSGKGYFLCPGCADHKQHAEFRAVSQAIKEGLDVLDADLYLYGHWWCCESCWNKMIEHGIKDVYLLENAHAIFARK
ncbi:MAG TPA: deaminase [Candidatus Bipolaricaulota bacterium]|nr:deaminase [Candidatus Bipolaricaulota bacterium]